MKYTMVGLTLFLLVTSAWAGTLIYTFDNDSNVNGWTQVAIGGGGAWQIENGELVLQVFNGGFLFGIGTQEATWKDYTVKVNLKIVKHAVTTAWEQAGIVFRGAENSGGYYVALGTPGWDAKQLRSYNYYMAGGPNHVESTPFEWELNTWYALKAVVEADHFEYYVNGKLVMEYIDSTHPTGGAGLGVTGASVTAHFDDFSVTGDDIPDSLVAVSSKTKLATTWGQIKRF